MSSNHPNSRESGLPESVTPDLANADLANSDTIRSDSIRSEFKQIIHDFGQYLTAQKENGNIAFSISNDSKKAMDSWGTTPETGGPFLFEGTQNARIVIIDSQGQKGEFFKSEGGLLLKKILGAIHLTPQQVFICNTASLEQIQKKVNAILPKAIITLGKEAAQLILDSDKPLDQLCGRFHDFMGVKVMPTLHPFLLIKQPEFKRQVWEDMKQVMAYAGLKNGS